MIEGLFGWQNQTANRVDAPERGAYRRFPWARLYDGTAAAWFAKQPANRPLGIALQELVPDKQALPANHGLPGVTLADVWGGAFIPDYNHPAFLAAYEAQIKRVLDLAGNRDLAADFAIGKWAENHWYGIPEQYRYLLPTLATTQALVALHLRMFGISRLLAPVDSRIAFDLLFDAGVRNVFHHGWGLIDLGKVGIKQDHFERHWAIPEYAARLDQCRIRVERGSEQRSQLNYDWMLASVQRHSNIIAVANDWPGILTASAETKAIITTIISTVANRMTPPPPPPSPPPPPTGDVAALQARIDALQKRLAQCEAERTAATTRAAILTTSARILMQTTAASHAAFAELEELTMVPE